MLEFTEGDDEMVKVLSLFCGAGGLDWGFKATNYEIIESYEQWDCAIKTYSENFRAQPRKIDVSMLSSRNLPCSDLIIGGPPCQGFSSLGKKDPNDARNKLILHTADLIAKKSPKGFIIENVTGLKWVSNGQFVRDIKNILLNRDGMSCEIIDIDCSKLGVPQKRRRVLIVGGFKAYGKKVITCIKEMASLSLKSVKVKNILNNQIQINDNLEPNLEQNEYYRNVIAHIGPGQKLCDTRLGASSVHSWDVPSAFGRTTTIEKEILLTISKTRRLKSYHGKIYIGDGKAVRVTDIANKLGLSNEETEATINVLSKKGFIKKYEGDRADLSRKFNGRFKRLAMDSFSPAITMEFACVRNIVHPYEDRGLTVRECARLQTFPDSFTFLGTKSQQYKMIANAFPPKVSKEIASRLKAYI